ncbi:O-antigen ligase family protein [Sphaerisporangium aureirubrum]|uniref:O-antigen ligase family protein n=1 Tax=Sphaerisporangium aureirubrum TaxID=1544736 RepID=A0ABW1NSQ3_9ACTN
MSAPETTGLPVRGTPPVPSRRPGTRPRGPVRRPEAATALRCVGGLLLAVLAWLFGELGDTTTRNLLGGAVLLLLPVDVLPAIVIVTVRDGSPTLGVLSPSDIVALVYLGRLALSPRLFAVRLTASRAALVLFLLWAVFVTVNGFGLMTALSRIAVYAAVGVAMTYRARGDAWLRAAVIGLSLTEILLYLPQVPERLRGFVIDDPSHAGTLFLAALIVVGVARMPGGVKALLSVLLLFGIAMTFTRAVWFATGVVALVALLPRRWYVPLLAPPLVALAAMPLLPAVTALFHLSRASGSLRERSMLIGWEEFMERPLTGHGWAFSSGAKETGLIGVDTTSIYNLWVYLGACTGLVGVALFLVYVALLGRAAVPGTVPYLFLTAVLAMSLTEMHLYGVSLVAVLFFTMTSTCGKAPATDSPAVPVSPGRRTGRGYCRR